MICVKKLALKNRKKKSPISISVHRKTQSTTLLLKKLFVFEVYCKEEILFVKQEDVACKPFRLSIS